MAASYWGFIPGVFVGMLLFIIFYVVGLIYIGYYPPNVMAEGNNIITPRVDNREYKIILLNTGMLVALVSDPDIKKAGASINVGAGSLDEP